MQLESSQNKPSFHSRYFSFPLKSVRSFTDRNVYMFGLFAEERVADQFVDQEVFDGEHFYSK